MTLKALKHIQRGRDRAGRQLGTNQFSYLFTCSRLHSRKKWSGATSKTSWRLSREKSLDSIALCKKSAEQMFVRRDDYKYRLC